MDMKRVATSKHIATTRRRYKGKTYVNYLLRHTYREGNKVKHKTLANLSHLPLSTIDLIRRSLQGETFFSHIQDLKNTASRSHGAVYAVWSSLHKSGLDQIIYSRNEEWRRVVVGMIIARILKGKSKLFATQWWQGTTLPEILDLPKEGKDVNLLYEAMDKLLRRQEAIQKKLAERHLQENCLVMYDLSSTYLEGKTCPLAAFGNNRDGKKGKRQFTYGLMTDAEGCPISVDVFAGNMADPKTVQPQIDRLQKKFGFGHVVFVGDRGMVVKTRIEDLRKAGLSWITALRARDIQRLRNEGILQLGLFDERNLAEIYDPEFPGERLIVCRNPLVAEERRRKRQELLDSTERELEKIQKRVESGRLRETREIALRVGKVINKWKVGKHFHLEIADGDFEYQRKEEQIVREAELDGIYVIRTNVSAKDLSAESAVTAYKSLKEVEQDIKDIKSMLELRPVFHRLEERVRAHVFLCLLAQYVRWHMRRSLKPLLEQEKQHSFVSLMSSLETIQRNTMEIQGNKFYLTTQVDELQQRVFAHLGLPSP